MTWIDNAERSGIKIAGMGTLLVDYLMGRWFLTAAGIGIDQWQLRARDRDAAKVEAFAVARGRLQDAAEALVACEQEHAPSPEARHHAGNEAWAIENRRRWKAATEAEELYLRRCSEGVTSDLLTWAGVPESRERSTNARLEELIQRTREYERRLREAGLPTDFTADTRPITERGNGAMAMAAEVADDDEGEEHGGDDLRAQARRLLATLPARPWKLAASGVSCDLGSMRLRLEGARDGKAEVVAALVALPVVLEQLLEEGKTT